MPNISEKAGASPFTVATALPSSIQGHIDALAQVDIASWLSVSAFSDDHAEQQRVLQIAFEEEQGALDALLQYPPRDLAEVRIKTAYFLERLDFLGCEDPRMVMFLRAMI
jgi:hypothetical protein